MKFFRLLTTIVALSSGVVTSSASTAAFASSGGPHCAYRLEATERHGRTVEARPVKIGCFATFRDAVSAGTQGAVTLDSNVTPQTLTDAQVDPTPLAFDVLIGTEYVDTDYQSSLGSSSYYASSTCSAGTIWEIAYVGDLWNDRFSSSKGFGGCDHNKKFEHSNFGGDVLSCTPNCAFYGFLNDRISSLRWKP